jgi:copper homeostasis protein
MQPRYIIEIATSDYATTAAAVAGGADRIELCANLGEGGTTPSYGVIKTCRENFGTLIYPIIRPRGGDFVFTDEEFNCMVQDVKLCKELGCDGVVVGLLNNDGTIDVQRTEILVNLAYPLGVTFHRAFDRCLDPLQALEQIISIGCERILTSGQHPNAMDGINLLTQLQDIANDRIIIMPGSGVRKENIATLAKQTGCTEFHTSLRSTTTSSSQFVHPAFAQDKESYTNNYISSAEVQLLRKALEE